MIRLLLLFGLAAGLSACAGRPKQMDPTRPFSVSEVRVMAQSVEDFGFADRLQQRLEASVGRATSDVGQTTALSIVVQDRRDEPSPVNLFGGVFRSASLDLTLIDASTGQVTRRQALRSTSADFRRADSETVLISQLTDDIRGLLGLSGYTPYPVTGAKRDVVRPRAKPAEFDAAEMALRSPDPLLNGTVTPTTVNLDVEPETGPAINIAKPLLDATPTANLASPEAAVAPPVELTRVLEAPAPKTEVTAVSMDADDEPCIITLESDCSDPDSH